MKTILKTKTVTRKHLADSKLGVSYIERLKSSDIKSSEGNFEIEDLGNGYAKIIIDNKEYD